MRGTKSLGIHGQLRQWIASRGDSGNNLFFLDALLPPYFRLISLPWSCLIHVLFVPCFDCCGSCGCHCVSPPIMMDASPAKFWRIWCFATGKS